MMMSHGVILGLLDLPMEILLEILAYLDVYELVRAHRICNTLLRVIDSSEELLYAIDLEYFQMVHSSLPGSVFPVATCRQLLRQSEAAWQKGEYSQRCHIPLPYLSNNYQLSCGVLGFATLKEIRFIQFPQYINEQTGSGTTSWRRWTYKTDREIVNHCFSPAQDLLVLLTRAPPGRVASCIRTARISYAYYVDGPRESHKYEVSFKSLSEDKVHPDAASAVVMVPDPRALFHGSREEGKIFGDYYVLLSNEFHSNGAVMRVWNWKVKDCYQSILIESQDPEYDMNFCLISNNRLLLIDEYGNLMLYSLVNFPGAIQLTAKFALPDLTSSSTIGRTHIISTQEHFSSTLPLRSSWFQASARSQLIAISMTLHASHGAARSCHVAFYAEQNSFLELEATYTNRYGKPSQYFNSHALPWSSWGPRYTWSFLEREAFDYTNRGVRSHGFRTADLMGDAWSEGEWQPRQLCIRDFNPHRVKRYKAGYRTNRNERLVEGGPLSDLPYLEITTQEKFLATTHVLIDESTVLLSCVGKYGQLEGIEVLFFT